MGKNKTKGGVIMKKEHLPLFLALLVGLLGCLGFSERNVMAQQPLRYSCSAQVYEAFENQRLEAFTKETGIPVDLYITSSSSAVNRLMNDFSDIVSTTRRLYPRHREWGYVEIPFCRDSLAVIVNAGCSVKNISSKQLEEIFSGDITNWEELGGENLPIVVIIPDKHTGAFKNFQRLVMKRHEIKYDLMAYRSTMVMESVSCLKGAISFITQGATTARQEITKIKIDGLSPKDKNYPYVQLFSFVTKGAPKGSVKSFIDFVFSPKGQAVAQKLGIEPLSGPEQVQAR